MAKYFRKESNIEITELSNNEILAILKANVSCDLIFTIDDIETDRITLLERTYVGNSNVITIENLGKTKTISYDVLISMISKNLSSMLVKVSVDSKIFKSKEALFLLLHKIKASVIESAVYFDFNNDIYSIIYRPVKGLSSKLFYFDLNDSVLLFSENGPKLIYNHFTAVEEVLCD
jgi:hypothetical protein